jgi:dTDP-glucose 4,6-dehydratase
MDKIKNLLITGGAGYVGSNTINTLFYAYPNITFIVVDLKPNPTYIKHHIVKSNRFKYYQENIGNNKKIMKILKKYKIKYVLDLASFLPWDVLVIPEDKYIANNIICRNAFFNTCIKYGKIKHIIYQSTVLVITNTSDDYNSSKNAFPPTQYDHVLYATTKSSGLSLAYNAQILGNLPITILSPAHIYGGKYQHTGDTLLVMVNEFCKTGKIVLGKYSNTNFDNWISIFDVIEAYQIIFGKGFDGKNYNAINSSQYFTPRKTAEMIVKCITGSTDFDNYIEYDECVLTYIPNTKLYNIKTNFLPNEFHTNNTFVENIKKIAKC